MAVHQVEEYYVHISFGGNLSPSAHDEIERLLSDMICPSKSGHWLSY